MNRNRPQRVQCQQVCERCGQRSAFRGWHLAVCMITALFNVYAVPYFMAFHPQETIDVPTTIVNHCSDWIFIGFWFARVFWFDARCRRRNHLLSSSAATVVSSLYGTKTTASDQKPKKNRVMSIATAAAMVLRKTDETATAERTSESSIFVRGVEFVAVFPYGLVLLLVERTGGSRLIAASQLEPTWSARAPRLLLVLPLLGVYVSLYQAIGSETVCVHLCVLRLRA